MSRRHPFLSQQQLVPPPTLSNCTCSYYSRGRTSVSPCNHGRCSVFSDQISLSLDPRNLAPAQSLHMHASGVFVRQASHVYALHMHIHINMPSSDHAVTPQSKTPSVNGCACSSEEACVERGFICTAFVLSTT